MILYDMYLEVMEKNDKSLWAREYYVKTIGNNDEPTIVKDKECLKSRGCIGEALLEQGNSASDAPPRGGAVTALKRVLSDHF